MNARFTLIALLSVASIFLTGCFVPISGTRFSQMKMAGQLPTPSKEKGLVYVYSQDLPLGSEFDVWGNEHQVASSMGYGKFFYFRADPGDLHVASEVHNRALTYGLIGLIGMQKNERVVFHVVAGETYYVDMHNTIFRETMDLVSKEEGEKKIQDCVWTDLSAKTPG